MIPDKTFDITRGFQINDIFIHEDKTYTCMDNTPDAAIWQYRSKFIKEDFATLSITIQSIIEKLESGTNVTITINPITNKIKISTTNGGLSFIDLVDILQEGDNITLDIDNINQTITINSNGGSSNWEVDTITLAQADWVLNAVSGYYEQTITLTGILSTSYVEVIAPTNRDYYNDYVDNQILLTSIAADTLTFEAIVEPLTDIIIEIRYII